MYYLGKIRLRCIFAFKCSKYMLFSCNPPSKPVAQWLPFFSSINALNSVRASSNWSSVCVSSILFERERNLSADLSLENTVSFKRLFTLCLKWNSQELHLVIKSSPYTFSRAFQLHPHSSYITPTGSNVSPAWKSAKELFQVLQNSSQFSLFSLSRMICFLNSLEICQGIVPSSPE